MVSFAVKVITMTLIVAIVLFFMGKAGMVGTREVSSGICSLFVNFRDKWEKARVPVMGARFAKVSNVHVPLVGCGTRKRSIKGNATEVANLVAHEVGSCWRIYGEGKKDILINDKENPSKCSYIEANIQGGMSPKNLTDTFQRMTLKEEKDCRYWRNDVDCNEKEVCPEGFQCFKDKPEYCKKESGKVSECVAAEKTLNKYQPCPTNYELTDTEEEDCYRMFSEASCKEGCHYNATEGMCVKPDNTACEDTEPSLPSIEGDVCRYCSYTGDAYLNITPIGCTILESTNSSCTRSISFYDYFRPGDRTRYSFSWMEGDERKKKLVGVNTTDYKVSGDTYIFVEYLDIFTETPKAAEIRSLPGECAAGNFVDSTVCKEICLDAAVTAGITAVFPKKVAAGAGVYVASGLVYGGWGTVKTAWLATSLQQCGKCIKNKYLNAPGVNVNYIAFRDNILVCVYEK